MSDCHTLATSFQHMYIKGVGNIKDIAIYMWAQFTDSGKTDQITIKTLITANSIDIWIYKQLLAYLLLFIGSGNNDDPPPQKKSSFG